ncbi:hypothetical protein AAG906_028573 [Vitis piasezkii]
MFGAMFFASGAIMTIKKVKSGFSQTLLKSGSSLRSKGHSDGIKCTHCGSTKHTRETYFKLHGYPDWWHELQTRKKRDAHVTKDVLGRAAVTIVESQLSLIPVVEPATSTPNQVTNHMIFDPNDFSNTTQPMRTCIANANGATYPITGAGTVLLSPSLSLAHTLLDVLNKEIIGHGTKRRGLYYLDDFSLGKALGAPIIWLSPVSTPIFIFLFAECGL